MHLSIVLEPQTEVYEIPIQYNYLVQSAIYNALSEDVGGFFHDIGFEHKGRSFRMFTFSRLMGKSTFQKHTKTLRFQGPLTFVVGSPIPQFCSSLATGLLRLGSVHIGSQSFCVRKVQVYKPEVQGNSVDVKMLSPTVVYKTMKTYEGKNYTCYFQPGETEFYDLTRTNLEKKYEILTQLSPPTDPPYRVMVKGRPRLNVLDYKGTVIKGYTCFLRLTGPQELLQVAIDAGLGVKNSQGFGCLVPDEPVPAREVYL